MESNNSSSTPSFSRNTATASSSDPLPRNQRNDDKGKQTCSNVSEANNNNNRSSKFVGVRSIYQMIIDNGAFPSPLGYVNFPKSVCTSVNECICRGIPDSRPLEFLLFKYTSYPSDII
ncbi:hypothetical protein K1719_021487 [Acacia pycnantha]|nr:hypothetical protein K1719_021487 [Acacia pycnantha]